MYNRSVALISLSQAHGTIFDNSEQQSDQSRFDELTKGAARIIFSARAVFPFDLFPDEIIIDENKVDVVQGIFFGSRQVYSIPLQNINGASSNTSIIFAGITIEINGYNQNPPRLTHFWRKDAVTARRVINGLVTVHKNNIDLSKLDLRSMKTKLIEIGRAGE